MKDEAAGGKRESRPSVGVTPALFCFLLLIAQTSFGQGDYFDVEYPPSTVEGELIYGVKYTLWVPEGAEPIRAIMVHQHGCGAGACKGGETAAFDLHWQALAKKWHMALLGPSFRQQDRQDCRKWCDPRNGSSKTFLKALDDLATRASRPELASVPWCFWGHSGGGFWSSLMQTLYPERIVAIWFRSGTAFAVWEKGEIPRPKIPAAAYAIPMMCNPGVKERDDARFQGAWTGAMAMFESYRSQGAPIGFAPDPRTGHECGDSRYLAIPFFDACLAARLPDADATDRALKPIDGSQAWLAAPNSALAVPAAEYSGDAKQAVWLPNETFARAWMEYVQTGAVGDTSPPPAPFDLAIAGAAEGEIELIWSAEADLESGLRSFVILRDGDEIASVPEAPLGRFGRPLFQTMSYHDTPEAPLPEMKFRDAGAPKGAHRYEVIAVNSVGLRSEPVAGETSR